MPPANANPSAAPMNGAVHGDAMTTASTPEPKASTMRFLLVHPATADGGIGLRDEFARGDDNAGGELCRVADGVRGKDKQKDRPPDNLRVDGFAM